MVQGRQRPLISVLPASYDSHQPHDLVLAFHGRTNPAAQVRGYYDLERHANRPTIFVYPSGLAGADGRFSWWNPGNRGDQLRDFALFDAIVQRFKQDYCIGDIYAVGHSLGASMVNSLACARGHVLRAAASLAGGIEHTPCVGELAVMLIHNPNDRLVPLRYGLAARKRLLAAYPRPATGRPSEPAWLNCERYGEPSDANPLLWCPHSKDHSRRGRYYPHNWPQGTGREIMRFFASLAEAD